MKNNKKILFKSYIYKILLILGLILIVWYIASWYQVKKFERLMESYLITSNTLTYEINDLNEINQAFNEVPSEYFVYISKTNDENIYNFERKLKTVIDDYNLSDSFYYVNVDHYIKKDNLYKLLSNTFNTNVENIPCLIFYKDGKIEKTLNKFSISDFKELLTTYEY